MEPPVRALPEAVKQFIRDAPVCRLASVRPGGEPHALPVCPVFDGDATVYVDVGSRSPTAKAIAADPRIAVLIDEYDDDWSRLKGVLLRCRAEETSEAERERAWGMIREKFPQYIGVGWEPRLTLALRIYDWREWGVLDAPKYEPQ